MVKLTINQKNETKTIQNCKSQIEAYLARFSLFSYKIYVKKYKTCDLWVDVCVIGDK